MTEHKQPLTEDELEVAFVAWALAAKGQGYVPTPEYLSAAEAMRARGWLSSWTLDNGDTAYAFSPVGEEAFKKSDALGAYAGRVN